MKILLRMAVGLCVAPLAIGIAIFVAWVIWRTEWLVTAGLIALPVNFAALPVAGACLLIYALLARRAVPPPARLGRRIAACVSLFLANFLLTAACVVAAMWIESCYTVTLTNRTQSRIDSASLIGGGVDLSLGPIAPGATVKRSFWIENDGQMILKTSHGPTTIETPIDGYVTGGIGGDLVVTLEPAGVIAITDRRITNHATTMPWR